MIADGERNIIPDHKLVLVGFETEDPAHFLSGILNSAPISLFVRSYAVQTSISGHIFDYVRIPEYSAKDALHRDLAALSKRCHTLSKTSTHGLGKAEEEIDQIVAHILNISEKKLSHIRGELEYLRGSEPAIASAETD